jgi:DNA-binding NarL/FixJ family response regulator
MQRLVVVSDHSVLAELLGETLAREADLEVVGVAASVEALATVEVSVVTRRGTATVLDPDVVVLAFTDDSSVMEAERAVRRRWVDAAVVLVAGQGAGRAEVLAAVRGSSAGLTTLSAAAVAVARDRLRSSAPRSAEVVYPQLSEREREVLEGLSAGAGPADIARHLGISLNTCRGYLRTLMAKLGARSQREVVAFVAKHGLPEVWS